MDQNEINPIVIEFTGVTGVGKTTLRKLVKDNLLNQGFCAKYAEEFVLDSYSLNFISQPLVRSILVDLLIVMPFISFMGSQKGSQLVRLGIRLILRDSNKFFSKANLLRNFAKRIGTYVFLQDVTNKKKNNIDCDFVLCDEGVLQSAHNLFVHTNVAPNIQEIESFKKLVPQPKIVVWIKASPEQSIQCILKRGHRRVEKDRDLVKQFVSHACLTFERLFSDQTINTKIIIVDRLRHDNNSTEKENKYLEQQVIQIIDLVKQEQEEVKC